MKGQITKPETRFWITVLSIIIVGVVAFVRLQEQVSALDKEAHDKGTQLKQEFETNVEVLQDIQTRVIKMEKDIEYIRLNID